MNVLVRYIYLNKDILQSRFGLSGRRIVDDMAYDINRLHFLKRNKL